MADEGPVVKRVRADLCHLLGMDRNHHPIALSFAEGVLTIEGEVPDIALKKRALELAASPPEVRWVADELHIEPASPMGDGEIRDHLRDALIAEPVFMECAIWLEADGDTELGRQPLQVRGTIRAIIANGVVTLEGQSPSLSHKRLAGVLAYWVPGVRDVVNDIEVVPPEEDNDGEISDAVRIVLEKDPLLDATQIGIRTDDSIVTLWGLATSEEQRRLAEQDAFYVFGVDGVINEIEIVGHAAPQGALELSSE